MSPVISGGEWRMISISERLRRRGCRVHLVTSPGGEECARAAGFKGEISCLPASLFSRREYWVGDRMWAYFLFIVNFLLRCRRMPSCDLVYSSSDYVYDTWTAWLYKRRFKARWLAMNHHRFQVPWRRAGSFLLNLFSYASQSISYRLMRKHADLVLALDSPAGDEIIAALGLPGDRCRRVANGLDLDAAERVLPGEKQYEMVFAGGLRSGKGFDDMAPIIARVERGHPGLRVAIIGGHTGRSRRLLERALEREGVSERVKLLGYIDSIAYIRVLKESRVYYSTSREEGWGISIGEAMACSLPVVAYDLPVYRQVYDERLNLVPAGDLDAFAAAVLALLADDETARRQGRENSVFVKRYDWEKIARTEYDLMRELAGG